MPTYTQEFKLKGDLMTEYRTYAQNLTKLISHVGEHRGSPLQLIRFDSQISSI